MRYFRSAPAIGIFLVTACSIGSLQDYFQPDIYVVAKGDTLYSIAWRYQLSHQDLAQWNQIDASYIIHPGQSIALTPEAASRERRSAAGGSTALLRPSSGADTGRPIAAPGKPASSANQAASRGQVRNKPHNPASGTVPSSGNWHWPTEGAVIQHYVAGDKARQGMDIAGQYGQPILASADGSVVYSGSGLASYGQLIIVKHDDTYLSAYAHNSKLLVAEGDSIRSGQKIAEMGKDNEQRVLLHFEIRKQGKPVNPLWYLKRR